MNNLTARHGSSSREAIRGLSFSPDDRRFVTASDDSSVRIDLLQKPRLGRQQVLLATKLAGIRYQSNSRAHVFPPEAVACQHPVHPVLVSGGSEGPGGGGSNDDWGRGGGDGGGGYNHAGRYGPRRGGRY
ncbi:hypothetical protein BDZ97DRAFT_1758324 [Flammula alnicola]|nr:hypothetical protein BDZ97DRAFT_1758324 [Flammula alnicola]